MISALAGCDARLTSVKRSNCIWELRTRRGGAGLTAGKRSRRQHEDKLEEPVLADLISGNPGARGGALNMRPAQRPHLRCNPGYIAQAARHASEASSTMTQARFARLRRLFHLHRWVYGATTLSAYRICQTCGKRQLACGLLGWETVPSKCVHCRGTGQYLDHQCRPGPCPDCAGTGWRDELAASLARDARAEAEAMASFAAGQSARPAPPPIHPAGDPAAPPPRPAAHKPTARR